MLLNVNELNECLETTTTEAASSSGTKLESANVKTSAGLFLQDFSNSLLYALFVGNPKGKEHIYNDTIHMYTTVHLQECPLKMITGLTGVCMCGQINIQTK